MWLISGIFLPFEAMTQALENHDFCLKNCAIQSNWKKKINNRALDYVCYKTVTNCGARWHSGRASSTESRGPGFNPYRRHHVCVLDQDTLTHYILVKPRTNWLCPDMTEKLLTRILSLNTNTQINLIKRIIVGPS